MEDHVHATNRLPQALHIQHVAANEINFAGQVIGEAARVNLRREAVIHPDAVTALQQRVHQVRPHETRTAGYQNLLSPHRTS